MAHETSRKNQRTRSHHRRKAPPALQFELFRAGFETAPSGLLVVDARGTILAANSQVEADFGYAGGELIGISVDRLLPIRYQSQHAGFRRDYLEHPEKRVMGRGRDLFGLRKDGSEFRVEVGLNPLEHQGETYVIAAVVDITERIRTQETYRSVFQAVSSPLFSVDAGNRITLHNPAFLRLTGRTSSEVEGRRLEELLDATSARRIQRALEEARVGDRPVEIHLSMPQGKEDHQFHWTLVPMAPRAGQPGSLIAIGHDVTRDREDVARQIHRHKMSALGLMASGIAHEVANPLAAISMMAEEVTDLVEDSDRKVTHCVSRIKAQIDRASRTLQQMLSFARPELRTPDGTDVRIVLQSTAEIARFHPRARHIKIELELSPELPVVDIPSDSLSQVFLNLLLNAFDAIPDDEGVIRVRDQEEDGVLRIHVHDSGSGVPLEIAGRIFDPFFSTKGSGEGTGLGLFMCRKILQEHGGDLTLDPQPGTGSCFDVTLAVASRLES